MEQDQTYTHGFNSGYKLQLYSPDVYALLENSLNDSNEWQHGIKEGAAQARKEKEQERIAELESLQGQQEQKKEQEEDLER